MISILLTADLLVIFCTKLKIFITIIIITTIIDF